MSNNAFLIPTTVIWQDLEQAAIVYAFKPSEYRGRFGLTMSPAYPGDKLVYAHLPKGVVLEVVERIHLMNAFDGYRQILKARTLADPYEYLELLK